MEKETEIIRRFDKEFPLGFFDSDDNLANKMREDLEQFLLDWQKEIVERVKKLDLRQTYGEKDIKEQIIKIIKGEI